LVSKRAHKDEADVGDGQIEFQKAKQAAHARSTAGR
jgi:hypothetical protein